MRTKRHLGAALFLVGAFRAHKEVKINVQAVMILSLAAIVFSGCTRSVIEGKVYDGFGVPVKEAKVVVQGTQFTSQTDENGQYSVEYVPGDINVLITKPGFTRASLSMNISTESRYLAEDKILYEIPQKQGIWLMDFDKRAYVSIKTTDFQLDKSMNWVGGFHRIWHESYSIQMLEDNHTPIAWTSNHPQSIFLDNTLASSKLVQLEYATEAFWDILQKQWTDGIGGDISRISILGEEYTQLENGIYLRKANLQNRNTYAFVDYSNWGGGNIRGLVFLFTTVDGIQNQFTTNNTPPDIQENTSHGVASSMQQQDYNTVNETPTPATYAQREIPTPTVPLVKAANVLPKWSQNEEIEGDHILMGLYVGSIGTKPIKISITGIDTTNSHAVGFSVVNNNRVDFEGVYDISLHKASNNRTGNIIDFDAYVFDLTLFEPTGIGTNGVFRLQIEVTDANGSSGNGTWTSYNGKLYREISVMDTYVAQER